MVREERIWNAETSKWKAALEKGLDVSLNGNENILYLGASSGTTVEQIAKLTTGKIFAVEKSNKMAIPLVRLAEEQRNIFPLFCDARDVDYIAEKVKKEKINILFCDIPSRDQVRILVRVAGLVDNDCKIYLSLKTQSISQKRPEYVKNKIEKELEDKFNIIKSISLEPFHKKHYFFVLEKS